MESINPFQSGSVPVSDRLPINRVYDNIYSEIVNNDFVIKEESIDPIEEVEDRSSIALSTASSYSFFIEL